MTVIEKYPCNSRAEAHLKERHVIEELKPTLNENIPCRSYKELREKNKEQYKHLHEGVYEEVLSEEEKR